MKFAFYFLKFPFICILLSLLPVIRILWLIDNTCVNVCSVDFSKAMHFINSALSGDFSQLLIFPSMSGHPQLIPLLIHYINARFFDLNAFCEYYGSILLLCISIYFAFDSMRSSKSNSSYSLLPALALLQFSLCLSSEFFYCYSLVLDALTRAALSIGIWAIAKVKNQYLAGLLMISAGFVCSSCFASFAISSWAIFGLLILALRKCSKTLIVSWLIGFLLSALPILVVCIQGTFRADPATLGIPTISKFFATVGMVFLNNTANSVRVDWKSAGLGFAGIVSLLLLTGYFLRRKSIPDWVYCSLAFALFGLLNIAAVAVGRIYISPWYCSFALFVWSSIVALAHGVLSSKESKLLTKKPAQWFALSVLLFCFLGYVKTNLSYADKDYFRMVHSPSAASCLRNYKWAPTYAYYQLFGSKMGGIETFWKFGNELSQHRLSCFAESQVWSMQGDFILPSVQFRNGNKNSSVCWILDKSENSQPGYSDPEHLTLQIPRDCSASWTLNDDEPVAAAKLEFDLCADSSSFSGHKLKVDLLDNKGINTHFIFIPTTAWRRYSIPIDLRLFPNPTIVFQNSAESGSSIPVFIKYPRATITFKKDEVSAKESQVKASCFLPSNVDSNPDKFGSIVSELPMEEDWAKCWRLSNLSQSELTTSSFKGRGNKAQVSYLKHLHIDTNDWNEFFLEFAREESANPRIVLCQFFLSDGTLKNAVLPILPDEQKHRYSFELKLLQLKRSDRITFLQILPLYECDDREYSFAIGRLGFAKRQSKSRSNVTRESSDTTNAVTLRSGCSSEDTGALTTSSANSCNRYQVFASRQTVLTQRNGR